MPLGLIAEKIGMTQVFSSIGNIIPVTLVKISESYVVLKKTKEKDGYSAIVVGSFPNNKPKAKKAQKSFFLKRNLPFLSCLSEFKISNADYFKIGDRIDLNFFNVGEKIKISGISAGKGTQGNIKVNNFKRGPMSHGSKHHRLQGSLGAGTSPGRVFPGKKMPKRLGNKKVSFYGIEVINISENIIALKGSIPGKSGNLIKMIKN